MRRPALALAAVLLAALALWLLWPRWGDLPSSTTSASPRSGSASAPASAQSEIQNPPSKISEEPLHLADDLNAPSGAIAQDLRILDDIFRVWQTNFLPDGNPVGENAEITAALTGKNRLRLQFIDPNHPAINARGELCDRWGTPFFFHQLSGARMEILSAGPDKKFHTDDDALLTP